MNEYYKLRAEVLNYAFNYYCLGKSLISDEEYDKLYDKLLKLKEIYNIQDNVIDKVNLGLFEGDNKNLRKVKHIYPMLSVEKSLKNLKNQEEIILMLKVDGVAIELIYKEGNLFQILTRGDGEYGLDITYLYNYLSIPKELMTKGTVVIRGELVSEIDKNNKNHRNIVAGYINRNTEIPKNTLKFFAYHLFTESQNLTYISMLELLKVEGFNTPNYLQTIYTEKMDLNNWYKVLLTNFTYPTDGIVLTKNKGIDITDKTSKYFRWNCCWKPSSEIKETTIKQVIWQVGKKGLITPVAIVEPIELNGAIVSRVSLSNLNLIRKRDIAINDIVALTRSNDIIPYIEKIIKRPENRIPIDLQYCPKCSNKVLVLNDGMQIYCENPECRGVQTILFFCKTLNITGLGQKSVEKLVDADLLTTPIDIYTLKQDEVAFILNSEILAEKIMKNIEKSKNVNIITLLSALSIPLVNKSTLLKIANQYDIIKDNDINPTLLNPNNIMLIKGIGEKKAISFSTFLENFNLQEWLGVGFTNLTKKIKEKPLLCITGKFELKRNEIINLLNNRYEITDRVTKKTSILLVGDKPSNSKISKAKEYNIKVVTLEEILPTQKI